MGFSARLSYLYQTNQVTYIDIYKSLDSFTDKYSRWDLTVSQKLNQAIQLYANFSNLNAVPDVSLRGGNKDRPSYIEYYGFSMDVGLRYRM